MSSPLANHLHIQHLSFSISAMQTLADISWLIPLLPLIGAAIAGFAGARYLRGQSHWPIWAGVGASAVLSLLILFTMIGHGENASLPSAGHAAGETAEEPESLGSEAMAEALDATGEDAHA